MSDNLKLKSQKGQSAKGVSGNPAGRPRGSRNKANVAIEALLEDGAERLISKAMEMALAGDTAPMRLCLERILWVRRDRMVHVTPDDCAVVDDRERVDGRAQVPCQY